MSNTSGFESENKNGNSGFAPETDNNNIPDKNTFLGGNTDSKSEISENPEKIEECEGVKTLNEYHTPLSSDNTVYHNSTDECTASAQENAEQRTTPTYQSSDKPAQENYQAPMSSEYNRNFNTPVNHPTETNGTPYSDSHVPMDGTHSAYNPSRRPVGESAGIRYDADKTSADGNYTWQYCQTNKPFTQGTVPEKKHNVLRTVSITLACVLVVGIAAVCGYFYFKCFGDRGIPVYGGENIVESNDAPAVSNPSKNEKGERPVISGKGNSDNSSAQAQNTIVLPSADGTLTKQMIAVKCKPSSVGIEVTATTQSYFGTYKSSGVGSGFILTEDGYIATNNHVIEDADEIIVMLDDGTKYSAEIIGADSVTDLAVIKIDARGLVPMEIGDSDLMQVGDSVIAIGTPAGIEFAGTVTDGIVSAINRDVEVQGSNGYTKTMTLMQTNAAINPGNSGGPLINDKGEVVGINTLKLTEKYEGIGFSIPINSAINIFNQLIQDGKVTDYEQSFVTGTGAIGITNYFEVTEEESKYYGIPVGVMVIQLKPGSSAQAAGLKRGDIITGFNGQKVTTVEEINDLKSAFKAGDQVTLTIYRDPKEIIDITFKLDVMG